jgi:hypothetical protein
MAKQKIIIDPTTLPGAKTSHNASNDDNSEAKPQNGQSTTETTSIQAVEMPPRYRPHIEATREAVKEHVKEEKKNIKKFHDLVDKSVTVLYKMTNIVPLLTSELIIDTAKVTIIHRPFLFSERIHSVSIRDIEDCFIETSLFFATLNIVDRGFVENVVQVRWVRKSKAEKARRIITGLVEAAKEQIDITKLTQDSLKEELEEIGKVREAETSVSKA